MTPHLIETIYDAVDDVGRWDDVLDALVARDGVVAAAIGHQPDLRDADASGVLRGARDPGRALSEVLEAQPIVDHARALAPGPHVYTSDEVTPRAALVESSAFRAIQRLGADRVVLGASKQAPHQVVYLCLFIGAGRPASRAHLELAAELLPHVRRSLALSRRVAELEVARRHSHDAIQRAHFGCVLVDEDLRVQWTNDYADAVFEREDALRVEQGRLRALHPEALETLQATLDVALGRRDDDGTTPRGTFRVPKADPSGHLELLVRPLTSRGHPILKHRRGALVMLADPDYLEEGIAERLCHLYGLTPTESEVTQWLLSGSTVDEIARVFGRSPHTVRHHIKHVLRKCGVSSQAQLVGLMHRGMATLQDDRVLPSIPSNGGFAFS
jgi:DNA-binding CsgD family transcriptional regulator